ncbi:MAG: hypothetical protein JJE22_19565 [Bacteroidia bacterium]|nr:hypothetical protein [Bacteroidia bacterium]
MDLIIQCKDERITDVFECAEFECDQPVIKLDRIYINPIEISSDIDREIDDEL